MTKYQNLQSESFMSSTYLQLVLLPLWKHAESITIILPLCFAQSCLYIMFPFKEQRCISIVFHSVNLVKHYRNQLSWIVQFQNIVKCQVLIFNYVSINCIIYILQHAKIYLFIGEDEVEEWGSGLRRDKRWESFSRRCIHRSCLWMYKKGLLAAYLDDVNKTKDEIGLIAHKID